MAWVKAQAWTRNGGRWFDGGGTRQRVEGDRASGEAAKKKRRDERNDQEREEREEGLGARRAVFLQVDALTACLCSPHCIGKSLCTWAWTLDEARANGQS